MIDIAIQLSLPLISVITTWLMARRRISGVVIALASQPLWIATAFLHRQWGVVATAVLNSGSLASGIRSWAREQRVAGSTPWRKGTGGGIRSRDPLVEPSAACATEEAS